MSKQVLVLSSSPRKNGNSDVLCDQFVLGALEAGHQVEKFFLRDKKINYCIACEACQSNGGHCVQQDDMMNILDKIMVADVLVMATPVYFYNMDAQMKTVIDRTFPRYTDIRGKEIYFIVTAADDKIQAMQRTIESFRGFTSCLSDIVEKAIIYGVGVWNKGDIKSHPAMKEAYEWGKNV